MPSAVSASPPLRFLLDGDAVEVTGVAPQTTLLEYLREHAQHVGTKEGCAEGDCGACTVVLAEAAPSASGLAWTSCNACIRLLPSLAGKAVFTVASLRAADGSLHPVQRALVDNHGSQCGFCTPGFVMSLFALYKNVPHPSRDAVHDALSGNLCRCTGYRPIVAAAQAMHALPLAAGAPAWQRPASTAEGAAQCTADGAGDDAPLRAALAALAPRDNFVYTARGQRWFAPRDLDALAATVAAHPTACLVAGATDVGLWITKALRDIDTFIYTGACRELQALRHEPSSLAIGAAVPLAAAFAALAEAWPELTEAWQRFASPPIRDSGTLGGNVANGSPIGDSMPVLLALGATVLLRRGPRERELPLDAFYVAYRKTALEPGEFVVEIRVPHRAPDLLLRAYKVGKRHDQDISAVFACFALQREGDRVRDMRIGCGGVAGTPSRATRTEAALRGELWNGATADRAAATLEGEFAPIDDMRASAAYRRRVLGNLLRRFALETTEGAAAPTRIEHVAVEMSA